MIHSYNCRYADPEQLSAFILQHQLDQHTQLLIQIFSNLQDATVIQSICSSLRQQLPAAHIIGTSSYAWLDCEQYSREGILLSFTAFSHSHIASCAMPLGDDQFATGKALAEQLCGPDTRVLILFADALNVNADMLLAGIGSVAPEVMVAGGLSADQWQLERTFVCDGSQVVGGGVVAASLSGERLSALNHYQFGWRSIGRQLRITRCVGSRVYTIDGEPAQQVFARYLGEHVKDRLLHHSVDFPLLAERNGLQVARAPMLLHHDGSISFAGSFTEGESVTIAYGDVAHIIGQSQAEFHRLPATDAEALFVYTCAGRSNYLQDHVHRELEALSGHNCSGCFSYGEIFHYQAHNELLNHTTTYLLLSESCALPKLSPVPQEIGSGSLSLDGLFHLVKVSSAELTELNRELEQRILVKTAQLERELFIDNLTGLPNRAQLMRELESDDLPLHPNALALIDIDQFRQFNDIYGFETGDTILQKLVERALLVISKHALRRHVRLYKLPGDEFALSCMLMNSEGVFVELVDAIRDAIEHREMVLDDNRFSIQVSCGIGFSGADSHLVRGERQPLLTKADMALRQARIQGTDREIFTNDLPVVKTIEHNLLWAEKLKAAIREGRIDALYQPIYSIDGRRIERFETLVRMVDEQGKLISPFFFLEVAKKSRLYHHLTLTVFGKSLEMIRQTSMPFSVNLSLLDLKHPETMATINDAIAQPELARNLTFEIVESEGFEDYTLVSEFIQRVQRAGCKIAIDDFGAGYSSFAHLAKLNVDCLKIDGSLIKTVDSDPKLRAVTSSIVQFANTLEISTVAEFVHSQAVLDTVRALGVQMGQGFLLAEPLTADQVHQLIARPVSTL